MRTRFGTCPRCREETWLYELSLEQGKLWLCKKCAFPAGIVKKGGCTVEEFNKAYRFLVNPSQKARAACEELGIQLDIKLTTEELKKLKFIQSGILKNVKLEAVAAAEEMCGDDDDDTTKE